MKRRVVISGLGIVSPNAGNVDDFWANLNKGRSAIQYIDKCDTTYVDIKLSGQIRIEELCPDIKRRFLNKCDDFSIYSLLAVKEALEEAKLDPKDIGSDHIGVYVGNNSGGWNAAEKGLIGLHSQGVQAVSPFLASNWFPAAPQGHISIYNNIKGYSKTVVADMASSGISISNAYKLVRDGVIEYMLAGGTENLINTWGLCFYQTNNILCNQSKAGDLAPEKAYQPFSKNRNGVVPAEGAGYVLLESYETAMERNAPIYGEICGCGLTNDGTHYLEGDPKGEQYARAIDISLEPGEIPDFISLNGTAIKSEDDSEVNGLNIHFGKDIHHVVCSCPKAFYGQTFGASGAMDVITACLSMRHNKIIKTGFSTDIDDNVNFDLIVNKHREIPVNSCLVMNKGLGGINNALYIKDI